MLRRLLIALCLLGLFAGPVRAQEELTITKIYAPTSTDLTLIPGSDVILSPVGKDVLPGTGYDVNLGALTKKYLTLHAAELWVETLVAQNTIATIGGRVLILPTTVFVQDVGTGDTTIHVKHNQMVSGDRTYSEANAAVEFFAITSAASSHSGHFDYTVTRNLDGTGANAWTAGDALANTGQTGNGFIDLYSVRGVKAGTEIGPTIVGNVRTSSTYNAWSPRWAIGNLDGLYSYSGSTYGAAFGVPGGARVTIDSTNGIRIVGGDNDEKVTIDTSGNATFDGQITVGTGRNQIRNSECRVSTDDWSLFTNHGLTTTLSFGLASFRLNNEVNTCFATVAGTPAAGTMTNMFNALYMPVTVGLKYEASAYIGLHRATSAVLSILWYDSAATLLSSSSASACTTASAGGTTLASFCRGSVIATAPASATTARIQVGTTHNGTEADPYVFVVRSYFGEASLRQEDPTEWGPAGATEIIGGLIKTDTLDARTIAASAITTSELAADSVTSAKIVAGTIVASDIATGTITADRMNVSTLSAIAADVGTLTAGTIDGVTIRAGSGDEVTLDSSGVTFTAGTGGNNKIKWSDGSTIHSVGDDLWITGEQVLLNSTVNPVNVTGSGGLLVSGDATLNNNVRVTDFGGFGTGRFVCHDNDGDLYSSATTCDGSAPAPLAAASTGRIETLEKEVADLRAELARVVAALTNELEKRQQ